MSRFERQILIPIISTIFTVDNEGSFPKDEIPKNMITEELEKRKTKDVQFKDVQCDRKLPRSSSLLINRRCKVCPYFGIQGRNSRLRDCTVLRFTAATTNFLRQIQSTFRFYMQITVSDQCYDRPFVIESQYIKLNMFRFH